MTDSPLPTTDKEWRERVNAAIRAYNQVIFDDRSMADMKVRIVNMENLIKARMKDIQDPAVRDILQMLVCSVNIALGAAFALSIQEQES